jgi:hypothetical protein
MKAWAGDARGFAGQFGYFTTSWNVWLADRLLEPVAVTVNE